MRVSQLFTKVATVGVVALVLAGCGGGSSSTASGTGGDAYAGPVGDGEGAISILAWPGYAENGSTDPAVDWVTPFEKASGCKATIKTFGTSDEAVSLMQGGGYDVVSASGDATLRLIYGDLVQPVNTDLVPSYADIFSGLKDQKFNSVDGQMYGIPHGRGANLLAYNPSVVTTAPDSWGVTFDPASPYAGKITGYDSPIFIADAALYLMKTKPELGIKDPYALDQTQFDAAMALLEQQKPIIGEYWGDYLKNIDALKSGSIVLGTTWQVNLNYANADGEVVKAVLPKEGATGWSDTWMVAKDTKNINCSYKWLDWIAGPEANAQVAEWFGEAPSNSKACALITDATFCDTYHAADEAFWNNVYFWNTPSEKCIDGRTDVKCVPYAEWSKAWSSLRNS
jgi:putative spermidine/putrescine transport system substrate-binding protein